MQYAKDEDFIVDFAKRTLTNYQEYKKTHQQYEVTQLINSSIGLLIIPQQRIIQKLSNDDSIFSDDLLKILIPSIKQGKKTEIDILRHMRNSISHSNLKIHAKEDNNEISSITFIDKRANKITFEMEISVETLEKLFLDLCLSLPTLIEKKQKK